ncbi:MAG: hypothetical protein JXJ22_12280, partial [Bacteroidales bacterium]|nr:hypothetical protein [Bacteroidales bacterium]
MFKKIQAAPYQLNEGLKSKKRHLAHFKNIFIPAFFILLLANTLMLKAQSDIVLQDEITGTVEVTATNSITMLPGFHAVEGCNFHAYISTVQIQYPSITVTSPSSDNVPLSGTGSQNYIKSITYREAKTSIPGTSFKHLESITYLDGLGRPVQSVDVGASPNGNDIIQAVFYDEFGREVIKPLPYTADKSGEFRTGVTETTVNNYYNSGAPGGIIPDNRAFSQIGYDNSPVNRILSQTGPGTAWADKPQSTLYFANNASDYTPGWKVNDDDSFTGFTYMENSLFVTENIDEQGNMSREYMDKQGRIVQKTNFFDEDPHGYWPTNYVYDNSNMLRCVVTPAALDPSNDDFCYYYNYDRHRRMTEKRIPGGGTVTMVYDDRDRLRCTQNSVQAETGEWSFTKYDAFNRPVITGTVVYSGDIQAAIDNAEMNEQREISPGYFNYTNESFPTSGATVLTVTYYDNYEFIDGLLLGDDLKSDTYDDGDYDFSAKTDVTPVGQVTGTMTRVLEPDDDDTPVPKTMLYSTVYYDKYGIMLRSISQNHLDGLDVVSNKYEDITYLLQQSRQQHINGEEVTKIEKLFQYDHTGRLLATREKINDQPEITLNALKYNELGQPVTKYLHSNQTSGERSFIQKVDYTYNIRGWLSQINDPQLTEDNDLFGMQLFYENTTGLGGLNISDPCYNGNISGMIWNTNNEDVKGYSFSYDKLNRLTNATYASGSSLNENTDYFSESVTSYDRMGNIYKLERKYNDILVDDLTYKYYRFSNQIEYVTDNGAGSPDVNDYPGTSGTYLYDGNGSMTYDGSRNSAIEYYSTLNLPNSIDFGNDNRIFYFYTANGNKVMKHVQPSGSPESYMHYIGNIVYENSSLSYIVTDEGRLVATDNGEGTKYVYEYNLKDHLGNTRVSFLGNNMTGPVDVVQTSDYYPFGLVMSQNNYTTPAGYSENKYLYNGKELQDDNLNGTFFGLYDYGFRYYDPAIARFTTIDPLSEKNHVQSG